MLTIMMSIMTVTVGNQIASGRTGTDTLTSNILVSSYLYSIMWCYHLVSERQY